MNFIFNAIMISVTMAIMVLYQYYTTEDSTSGSVEKFPENEFNANKTEGLSKKEELSAT